MLVVNSFPHVGFMDTLILTAEWRASYWYITQHPTLFINGLIKKLHEGFGLLWNFIGKFVELVVEFDIFLAGPGWDHKLKVGELNYQFDLF